MLLEGGDDTDIPSAEHGSMKNFISTLPTTLLILAALLVVSAAPPPSGTEAATGSAAADVSTESASNHPTVDSGELRDFAETFLAVAAVRHRFHRERATLEDEAAVARLERRAEARLRGIFAQSSMSLDRYTEIGRILTEDATQRRRFEELVLEMTGGAPRSGADVPADMDAA